MSVRVKFDIDNVCRTCLSTTTNLRSLTALIYNDRTIFDVLSDILDEDIELSEQLPYQICNECEEVLYKCEKLRQTCVKSEAVLKNWVISVDDKSSIASQDDTESIGTPVQYQCSICRTNYKNIPELEEHFSLVHLVKTDVSYNYFCDNNLNDKIKEEVVTSEESSDADFADLPPEKTEEVHSENVITQVHEPVQTVEVKIEDTYQCHDCSRTFTNSRALHIHVKKKHGYSRKPLEKFQCSSCMRKFTKQSALEQHIKRHEEMARKAFTCRQCKREFKHHAHLVNHINSAHKDIEKVDDDTRQHCCNVCGKGFQMLSTLKDHYRVHTGEKPYLCATCGRGFSQKTNLKEHMRRHLGLKPFSCSICDQKFVSKGELTAHLRTHSGAHPFICETCNSSFTTSSSLGKHRRIHTGEKPFACDLCPMKFSASSTLKNHRRTHTGEKPFHCAHCDKAFVQRNDLIAHTRCHTGEKPYVCAVCGQAFRQASTLKCHVKIHTYKESSVQNKECLNRDFIANMVCENSGSGSS